MKTLLLLLLTTLTAAAQTTVEFYSRDFGGGPQNKVLTITPVSTPLVISTNIYTGGPTNVTPTNGLALAYLIPHDYRVSWAGLSSPVTIRVPDTNAPVNAATILITSTNATGNAAYAWTTAASDARYARNGQSDVGFNGVNFTNMTVWGGADGTTKLWDTDELTVSARGTWYFRDAVDFTDATVEGLDYTGSAASTTARLHLRLATSPRTHSTAARFPAMARS